MSALNFNGEGPLSDVSELQPCTFPSSLPAPTISQQTETSIYLSWEEPVGYGGCPILSYHIYLTPVSSESWTELHATDVNNKPLLRGFELDLSSETSGSYYRVKMGVANVIGEIHSDSVAFLLAGVPD